MEDFVKVSLSDTSKLQPVFKCWKFLAVRFFSERGRLSLQTSLRGRRCTQSMDSPAQVEVRTFWNRKAERPDET